MNQFIDSGYLKKSLNSAQKKCVFVFNKKK